MKRSTLWFGACALIITIFGTIYTAVQQAQRADANYPQIQMAENTKELLNNGKEPTDVLGVQVDMSKNLAPFVIIYDKSGHKVAGSGTLHSQVPSLPLGALKAADNTEYHAVTWQPEKNVRIAAVSVAAKNYYVVSGRSLKEVEKNESLIFRITALGTLLALAIVSVLFRLHKRATKTS